MVMQQGRHTGQWLHKDRQTFVISSLGGRSGFDVNDRSISVFAYSCGQILGPYPITPTSDTCISSNIHSISLLPQHLTGFHSPQHSSETTTVALIYVVRLLTPPALHLALSFPNNEPLSFSSLFVYTMFPFRFILRPRPQRGGGAGPALVAIKLCR